MVPAADAEPALPGILLVEDEPLIRMALAEDLREAGCTVIEAAHADEAWAILTAGAPVDVIYSDIDMPGSMDGLELARRVGVLWPQIPVVLTSGNNVRNNNYRIVAKPTPTTVIMRILFEAIGASRRPEGA